MKKLSVLNQTVSACNSCEDLKCSRVKPTAGFGEGKIVFVFSFPLEKETKINPFASTRGNIFGRILDSLNIDKKDVYITYLVKCKTPLCRKPTVEETSNCLGYLIEELSLIKPKNVIGFGKYVSEVITNEAITSRFKGTVFSSVNDIDVRNSESPRQIINGLKLIFGKN